MSEHEGMLWFHRHVKMYRNLPLKAFIEDFQAIRPTIDEAVLTRPDTFPHSIARSNGYRIYPFNSLERLLHMARKQNRKAGINYNEMQFINFRFSASERDDFDKWMSHGDKVTLKAVHEVCQDDVRISLSWDAKNDCFICAMTGKEDSLNAGKCLTVRGKTWERALFAAGYVHSVVYKGEVWEGEEDSGIV